MLTLLPYELINLICQFCTVSAFVRILQTCKKLTSLSKSENIWANFLKNDFEVDLKVIELEGN